MDDGHWVNRSLIAGLWTKELCTHILQAASNTLVAEETQDAPFQFVRGTNRPTAETPGTAVVSGMSRRVASHECTLQWQGREPCDVILLVLLKLKHLPTKL